MERLYSWPWVEAQVARTIEVWNSGAGRSALGGVQYSAQEQQQREKAYDEALRAVERELKRTPRSKTERLQTQARITAAFARFSATALGLEPDAIDLLTNDFLPVGTKLARWARQFDPSLSMPDIVQACRNAWTACGLQPLLGEAVSLTPSILGYSLLYPYSDNYLDQVDTSREAKLRFSERFRDRLRGESAFAEDDREAAIWTLVSLIEEQYPRADYPEVFDCLLAIHRAQEQSIGQLGSCENLADEQLLAMSCAKGGTSVMADACLSHGWLSPQESRFSFEWGVLLQLGDDLQDVRQDLASRIGDAVLSRSGCGNAARCTGDAVDPLQRASWRADGRLAERKRDAPRIAADELAIVDHWSDCGVARIFYAAISRGGGALFALSLWIFTRSQ